MKFTWYSPKKSKYPLFINLDVLHVMQHFDQEEQLSLGFLFASQTMKTKPNHVATQKEVEPYTGL